MDSISKQEFRIREVSTRTVTLFPTRAQVVRDIKNVVLKPGANEITILGLSPSVDEDSIKVEGTGSAIISDISVELLPNRDIFEEIYPDSDDDASDGESDNEPDIEQDKVDKDLEAVNQRIIDLEDDQKRANEILASAESRLRILDAYANTIERELTSDIGAELDAYRIEREKVHADHMAATIKKRQISTDLAKIYSERGRLALLHEKKRKQACKAKAKAEKAKQKEAARRQRRKDEVLKERRRIRQEREKLWPTKCWSVRITLDAVSLDTPGSSRRSSIASASDLVKVMPDSSQSPEGPDASTYTCDLSLTYVVSSAYWSPSYDLSLSTTTNTALLCFDAQLTNKTSENWTSCKIVLSTSQATFAGVQDAIPKLVPWRVRLNGRGGGKALMLDSREERAQKEGWQVQQSAGQKERAHLYGYQKAETSRFQDSRDFRRDRNDSYRGDSRGGTRGMIVPDEGVFYQWDGTHRDTGPVTGFGASTSFGATAAIPPPPPAPAGPPRASPAPGSALLSSAAGGLFSAKRKSSAMKSSSTAADEVPGSSAGEFDDSETILEGPPELSFQETSFEETGLTTTYDLPGLKTLSTSSTASKQRVARVSFQNVLFSHTIVPKYKPAAFLKAKLRNGSKLTLLKGPAGLTLDGSFMGRSTLPRCSAGDFFTLSLGIDPAIDVSYPKPDVRRSTSGIFSKEDSSVYVRSATVANTRSAPGGKPVRLVVLDQVPVSEDERLRVAVVQPRGLAVGGAAVPAALPGKKLGEGDGKDWGRAEATLRKDGEVKWDVTLNPGRSVKLLLEYEVAVPGGEGVVQV